MIDIGLIGNLKELAPIPLLAAVAWLLGFGLKKTPKIPNELTPWVVAVFGAVAYPFIADVTELYPNLPNPTFYNILIGFLVGGAATWGTEAIGQLKSLFGKNKETPPSPPAP